MFNPKRVSGLNHVCFAVNVIRLSVAIKKKSVSTSKSAMACSLCSTDSVVSVAAKQNHINNSTVDNQRLPEVVPTVPSGHPPTSPPYQVASHSFTSALIRAGERSFMGELGSKPL